MSFAHEIDWEALHTNQPRSFAHQLRRKDVQQKEWKTVICTCIKKKSERSSHLWEKTETKITQDTKEVSINTAVLKVWVDSKVDGSATKRYLNFGNGTSAEQQARRSSDEPTSRKTTSVVCDEGHAFVCNVPFQWNKIIRHKRYIGFKRYCTVDVLYSICPRSNIVSSWLRWSYHYETRRRNKLQLERKNKAFSIQIGAKQAKFIAHAACRRSMLCCLH